MSFDTLRYKWHKFSMVHSNYPYADTEAALMLSSALARAKRERGLSVRRIGASLGYSQAVVLSHMASGRVPIPIDRAEDFANALEMPQQEFLALVLKQRHPNVNWSLLFSVNPDELNDFVSQEAFLTTGLALNPSYLTKDQTKVMREVCAVTDPMRHWLTAKEVPVMEAIRRIRPDIRISGLEGEDLAPVDKQDSQARQNRIQDNFCGGYRGAVADGGCGMGVFRTLFDGGAGARRSAGL